LVEGPDHTASSHSLRGRPWVANFAALSPHQPQWRDLVLRLSLDRILGIRNHHDEPQLVITSSRCSTHASLRTRRFECFPRLPPPRPVTATMLASDSGRPHCPDRSGHAVTPRLANGRYTACRIPYLYDAHSSIFRSSTFSPNRHLGLVVSRFKEGRSSRRSLRVAQRVDRVVSSGD
jgi:hypothetical protein